MVEHIFAVEHSTHKMINDAYSIHHPPTNYVDRLFEQLKQHRITRIGVEYYSDKPLTPEQERDPENLYWRHVFLRAKKEGVDVVPLEGPKEEALQSLNASLSIARNFPVRDAISWNLFVKRMKDKLPEFKDHVKRAERLPALWDTITEHCPNLTHQQLTDLYLALTYHHSTLMLSNAAADRLDAVVVGGIHGVDMAHQLGQPVSALHVIDDSPYADQFVHGQAYLKERVEGHNQFRHLLDVLTAKA
ncbi:hypothetical protein HY572_06510 [Candidatus Micrarchaeota archaeon]|nr:hypothetical protein [Candidatus Micrarchaeota archaeon]